jgi:hypothetical protein
LRDWRRRALFATSVHADKTPDRTEAESGRLARAVENGEVVTFDWQKSEPAATEWSRGGRRAVGQFEILGVAPGAETSRNFAYSFWTS